MVSMLLTPPPPPCHQAELKGQNVMFIWNRRMTQVPHGWKVGATLPAVYSGG